MARVEMQRIFFKNVFVNVFGFKQSAFHMELEGGREHLLRHVCLARFDKPVSNMRMSKLSVWRISVFTVDLDNGQKARKILVDGHGGLLCGRWLRGLRIWAPISSQVMKYPLIQAKAVRCG